jgi:hypothetical protein
MIECAGLLPESGITQSHSGRAGSGLSRPRTQSAGDCQQLHDDYANDLAFTSVIFPDRSEAGRGATRPGCSTAPGRVGPLIRHRS